jgi:predicted Zn-dependent protease
MLTMLKMDQTLKDTVPRLMAELADRMTSQREFERSRVLLEGLLELRPESPYPLILMGNLEFARGDFRAAERNYRQGLGKDPSNELAKTFLAQSLLPQRRLREAEPLLSEVAESGTEPTAVAFAQSLAEAVRQGVLPGV